MSRIVGDYDCLASSNCYSRGQRSTSQHLSRERLLGVDDLAALPKGRAVVFSSGNRPTLTRRCANSESGASRAAVKFVVAAPMAPRRSALIWCSSTARDQPSSSARAAYQSRSSRVVSRSSSTVVANPPRDRPMP